MPKAGNNLPEPRGLAVLALTLGLLAYPLYQALGPTAAGAAYMLGLVPSLALALGRRGSWGMGLARVGLSLYGVLLLVRFAEALAWGDRPVYVLEKLAGLGALGLVVGGYPYLTRPRSPLASLAALGLFTLVALILYVDCPSPPPAHLAALLLPLLVVNSLFEEGLFRGLLQSSLSPRLGRPAAVGVQALLFSAWHLPHTLHAPAGESLYYLAATLLVGLSLGVVVVVEGSLLTPVVVHTLWNLGVLYSCSGLATLMLSSWGMLALLFLVGSKFFRKGVVYTR